LGPYSGLGVFDIVERVMISGGRFREGLGCWESLAMCVKYLRF